MPPPKTSARQLQVEGNDDQHTIIQLVKRHGYDWDEPETKLPFVKNMGGKDNLLANMVTTLKSPATHLGFVLDADENIDARWAQVRDRFASQSLELPKQPNPYGTIIERGSGLVGVWLMPDNSTAGAIESFIATLVPDGDPAISYAEHVARYARENKGVPCAEKDHAKSMLHTWLAWQETPGQPYGMAITAQVLRHDSELAFRFLDWLIDLYNF